MKSILWLTISFLLCACATTQRQCTAYKPAVRGLHSIVGYEGAWECAAWGE